MTGNGCIKKGGEQESLLSEDCTLTEEKRSKKQGRRAQNRMGTCEWNAGCQELQKPL